MSAPAVEDARCYCGNVIEWYAVACEWCLDHEGCTAPESVRVGRAWLSGTPLATCEACGRRWGYWDCACDLVHDCAR